VAAVLAVALAPQPPRHAGCNAAREKTMEPITFTVAAVVGLGILAWAVNHGRNRSFTKEVPVFRASRWTKGNRIWPTQVAVFPNRVVRYTPRLFGHFEETIGIDQVASVSVDSSLIFGDVIIETTGGSQPIRCHGHLRGDAEEIRRQITESSAAQPRLDPQPRPSVSPRKSSE
jgi:hypothetical protein